MKNISSCLLALGFFSIVSCGQRKTEEAISTPVEVPVEGSISAPADGVATGMDTMPKDNTETATTSGRGTPPSR